MLLLVLLLLVPKVLKLLVLVLVCCVWLFSFSVSLSHALSHSAPSRYVARTAYALSTVLVLETGAFGTGSSEGSAGPSVTDGASSSTVSSSVHGGADRDQLP